MKNSKNPALFLLAMLKNANATMQTGPGRLEIGPPDLARKMAPKIIEHKANLVRFLLDLDCPVCGLEMLSDWSGVSMGKAEPGKFVIRRFCSQNHHSVTRQHPDFPVYGKDGKEI